MALDQSVLSELLDAFRTGEGLDLIREAVALVCQELIESELTAQIGADRYERTEARINERNGHRARVLSTKAGDVELAIPKLRKGSFFPSILEPRRRIDQALYAVVMEAYVHGVSTRAVDELVAALGWQPGISSPRSPASVPVWTRWSTRSGSAGSTTWPSPTSILDATYLHVRENHQVTSKAVVIATGVSGQRAPGDPGHRRRRLRERGLLAGVLAHARAPGGSTACSWSSPTSTPAWWRHQALLPRGGPPALPGPLRPQPAGQHPQGPPGHGVGRLPDRLRPGVSADGDAAQWDHVAATLEGRFAKARRTHGRGQGGGARLHAPSRERTGARSGRPTRSSASTRSSSAAAGSSASSPTRPSVIRLGGAVLLDIHDEWVSAERRYFSEASMAKLYRRSRIMTTRQSASSRPLTDRRRGLPAQSPPLGGTRPSPRFVTQMWWLS